MKSKLVRCAVVAMLAAACTGAQAAATHLGMIPYANLFDVSFENANAANGPVIRTVREGGLVTSAITVSARCVQLTRAMVVTDANVSVGFVNPNGSFQNTVIVYGVYGNDPPVPLVYAKPDSASVWPDMEYAARNFTGGVPMPADSLICINTTQSGAKYDFSEARVSGYYPPK